VKKAVSIPAFGTNCKFKRPTETPVGLFFPLVSIMRLSIKIQLSHRLADGHQLYCRTKLANKAA
jgi:hypothetical protein